MAFVLAPKFTPGRVDVADSGTDTTKLTADVVTVVCNGDAESNRNVHKKNEKIATTTKKKTE